MTDNDTQDLDQASLFNDRLLAILAGIAALFLFGALTGYIAKIAENGSLSAIDGILILGLIAATVLAGSFAWSKWRKAAAEPEAKSARKSRNIYIAATLLGGVLGAFIMIAGGPELDTMFSNNPISASVAVISIAGWAIGTPLITLIWWQVTDEHEIAAYSNGALLAFHLYVFLVPSWWMAARAGWVPQQDPMIIWAITMVVWSIAWLYKKYA
ncbi:hypothetical protein QWY75_04500 [Pontixanthobacter aestiaquae]|uniref:Uncharacterized protein n=1 Tax=Pontixanthobacter aestiaquae TaxID=1509367 RepID=A0A844Z887_9SPHN|nr:hypothetical protein [Pontixanthobacter aestiaquae]MDN3645469.1 hypothetical protein [Pontixanthobacter aestiaquae]MXO83532.1 hypothetical protein [Pontixanthobacter aestiaquae]